MRWEEPGEGEEPGILGSTRRPGRAIPGEWVTTMQTCLSVPGASSFLLPREPMEEGCCRVWQRLLRMPHTVPLTDGPQTQDFMLPAQGYLVVLMASCPS